MRDRRVALIVVAGVAAIALVVSGAAMLLDLLDRSRADEGAASPPPVVGAGVPAWSAEIEVPPAGQEGVNAEGFRPVGGIALGDDALLVDASSGSLLRVGPGGTLTVTQLQPPQPPLRATPRFSDLALSGEGNLLVTDLANGQIWTYSTAGRLLGPMLTQSQKAAAELHRPAAIVIDRRGRILVADVGDHRIKTFNRLGGLQASWGGEGLGPGEFRYPSDIAVDQTGMILVADSENRRVQVLDAEGRFVRAFQGTDTPDGLVLPRSLSVDDKGQVHVVDTFAERVSVFDDEGVFRFSYGHDTGPSHSLSLPEGIVLQRDRAIVGDRGNGRVTVFAR